MAPPAASILLPPPLPSSLPLDLLPLSLFLSLPLSLWIFFPSPSSSPFLSPSGSSSPLPPSSPFLSYSSTLYLHTYLPMCLPPVLPSIFLLPSFPSLPTTCFLFPSLPRLHPFLPSPLPLFNFFLPPSLLSPFHPSSPSSILPLPLLSSLSPPPSPILSPSFHIFLLPSPLSLTALTPHSQLLLRPSGSVF